MHVCALGYRNLGSAMAAAPLGGPLQSPCSQESWCMSPPYPDLPEFPGSPPNGKALMNLFVGKANGDANVDTWWGRGRVGRSEKVASTTYRHSQVSEGQLA